MRLIFVALSALLFTSNLAAESPRAWVRQATASRIILHIRELGIVTASLRRREKKNAETFQVTPQGAARSSVLLEVSRGEIAVRKLQGTRTVTLGASGSYKRGTKRVIFLPFTVRSLRRGLPRAISYEILLASDNDAPLKIARVRRRPLREFALCQDPLPAPGFAIQTDIDRPVMTQATTRYLGLRTEIDSRFYSLYGVDTAAITATILARVNTIFTEQLGIELRLVNQTIYTTSAVDPYAQGETSDALLSTLRDERLDSGADLVHLFTSSRGYLDAIGLAFIGVVCANPDFRFGWSDYASGFDVFAQTVAHELGHNFNATHDTTDPRSLMSVSALVNFETPYFSPFSLSEISSHLASNSSCLLNDDDPALPSPGSVTYPLANELATNIRLSISKRVTTNGRGRIGGRVRSIISGALEGRIIELRRYRSSKLVATTLSNSSGAYRFSARARGSYYTVDRMSQKSSPTPIKF